MLLDFLDIFVLFRSPWKNHKSRCSVRKLPIRATWAVFCVLFLLAGVPAEGFSIGSEISSSIKELLFNSEKFLFKSSNPGTFRPTGETLDFYQQRNYTPAWVAKGEISQNALILLDCLRSSFEDGFCPDDYHLQELETLIALQRFTDKKWHLPNPYWRAQLDILFTDAFMLYTSDFIHGRVNPLEVDNRWRFRKTRPDLVKLLFFALEKEPFCLLMAKLKPSFPGYGRLASGLAKYRRLVASGGWSKIPSGPSLRLGDRDPRVAFLRKRLTLTGEMDGLIEQGSDLFDSSLKTALIRFQRRHGLVDDGVLGANTIRELNVSAEERVRQIEVNLERLRWLPKSLGENYLAINIPDLQLTVYEKEKPVMWMPVIVGRAYRKTPVFSARMTYLEFSPYWYVPPTILKEDKLPKIQKDPGWLERNNFEIIPWRGEGSSIDPAEIKWDEVEPAKFPGMLRQKPGPWNPLGRVKFMFPNPYAVYLHDTNERHLFSRDIRLFSSGCIRIERPLDLAQYLLREADCSCEELYRVMNLSHPLQVDLPKEIPVYIFYMTAWVDQKDTVQFRNDIYLKDRVLDQLLLGSLDEQGGL